METKRRPQATQIAFHRRHIEQARKLANSPGERRINNEWWAALRHYEAVTEAMIQEWIDNPIAPPPPFSTPYLATTNDHPIPVEQPEDDFDEII